MFKKIIKTLSGLRFIMLVNKFPDNKWESNGNVLSQTFNGNRVKLIHTFESGSSKIVCEVDNKIRLTLEDNDGFLYNRIFRLYYILLTDLNTKKCGYDIDENYLHNLINEIAKASMK